MVVGMHKVVTFGYVAAKQKNVMDGHSIKIRIKIYTRSTLHTYRVLRTTIYL